MSGSLKHRTQELNHVWVGISESEWGPKNTALKMWPWWSSKVEAKFCSLGSDIFEEITRKG